MYFGRFWCWPEYFSRTIFLWSVRVLCEPSLRLLLLFFCVSLMIMSLIITYHLPCRIDHKTNPSGQWSEATNGKLSEELSWNSKWSLGMGLQKKSQVLRALRVSFCPAVHSGNTSCPTIWRVADLLYGLWIGWCEGGGRHVKVPGHRNQREETASQGRRSPTDGILTDRRGQVYQSCSLSGEATSLGHCGSSVSPIS